ncbi:MAG: bifunctional methylenetetrahydrofolate dehydrogenase/methenyltetrahydrofolate cyclohydrolase FolD [Lachnospiraceae bacterium]|nr:bifunctional methylenetetrahydrofolate dehydrogenase/methenyltetrahydrofolate cyclohydrolase FolD [Lachnospiraceae bacterium]MBR1913208.1 bifunctional methylenetetrahydrofolate dehydrogenase/methenyltetrahydrofolate cyclohydrolase FolD [Lachnospiraceae bacterium]
MAVLIDGKKISQEIKDEVRDEISKKGIQASLAVIIVGDDPASRVYVRNKKEACEYCGIRSLSYELPEETAEEELLALINKLNADDSVDGILVQLPLPDHINEDSIIEAIDPMKDVDGFSRRSVGALSIGTKGFVSCTPAGIIELLKRSGIEIAGKECVVMGRSNIVGKPMAMLMLRENATVTVVHSRTRHIEDICRRADILIVAIGKPRLITHDYVKDGAVVIDVGIHRVDPDTNNGRKLCGDVDFDEVSQIASAITPVPGGVGPMTIAMLMKNVLLSAGNKIK